MMKCPVCVSTLVKTERRPNGNAHCMSCGFLGKSELFTPQQHRVMPIERALRILSQVHTRDDPVAGFIVEMGATPVEFSQNEYIEAWRAVRHAVGLKINPEIYEEN